MFADELRVVNLTWARYFTWAKQPLSPRPHKLRRHYCAGNIFEQCSVAIESIIMHVLQSGLSTKSVS